MEGMKRLGWLVNRLCRMTPAEINYRVYQKIQTETENLALFLHNKENISRTSEIAFNINTEKLHLEKNIRCVFDSGCIHPGNG